MREGKNLVPIQFAKVVEGTLIWRHPESRVYDMKVATFETRPGTSWNVTGLDGTRAKIEDDTIVYVEEE